MRQSVGRIGFVERRVKLASRVQLLFGRDDGLSRGGKFRRRSIGLIESRAFGLPAFNTFWLASVFHLRGAVFRAVKLLDAFAEEATPALRPAARGHLADVEMPPSAGGRECVYVSCRFDRA